MELSPCLNKTALPLRERARDHLNGINAEDGYLVLIVGMKMSGVMRRTCLRKHPDDDPEEPTELRHRPILPPKRRPTIRMTMGVQRRAHARPLQRRVRHQGLDVTACVILTRLSEQLSP